MTGHKWQFLLQICFQFKILLVVRQAAVVGQERYSLLHFATPYSLTVASWVLGKTRTSLMKTIAFSLILLIIYELRVQNCLYSGVA